MTTICVIGNGESRKNLDLNNLNFYKIGCNAIYRDFYIDELVCVDRRMVREALSNNFTKNIYTRQDWINDFVNDQNVKVLPTLPFPLFLRADDPFNWGSGPYSLFIAAQKASKILIIGFDLFSEDKFVNNIYKDTENYDKSSHHAIDPRYWIYQAKKIFTSFPLISFIIYQKYNWQLPDEWRCPNVFLDNLNNLKYN